MPPLRGSKECRATFRAGVSQGSFRSSGRPVSYMVLFQHRNFCWKPPWTRFSMFDRCFSCIRIPVSLQRAMGEQRVANQHFTLPQTNMQPERQLFGIFFGNAWNSLALPYLMKLVPYSHKIELNELTLLRFPIRMPLRFLGQARSLNPTRPSRA